MKKEKDNAEAERYIAEMRYPVVLAHGIMLKDVKFFKAFGRIEKKLKSHGYKVYTAKTDGFGTIENNAEQLKAYIEKVKTEENAQKVNIIAYSKGGLDSKYMIEKLDMADSVASLTTLCTPHKGSPVASFILRLPKWLVKFVAFWVNLIYRIFGDKHPDSVTVCRQLSLHSDDELVDTSNVSDKVYCQSYSSSIEKSRDDFIMGIPLLIYRRLSDEKTDGVVSEDSSKFGEYRGSALDETVSHLEIAGFAIKKKKRERIYEFYLQICKELEQKGF